MANARDLLRQASAQLKLLPPSDDRDILVSRIRGLLSRSNPAAKNKPAPPLLTSVKIDRSRGVVAATAYLLHLQIPVAPEQLQQTITP